MPVVIPLAVWLAGLVILGLAITARVWATALIKVLAAGRGGGITRIITLPLRLIERVVTPGVNYITHVLTKAALHYTHPIARWFDAWALWYTGTVTSVLHFAQSVAVSVEHGFTVTLPRDIRRATRPIDRKAAKALGLAGLTAAALKRYAHGIDRLLRERVIPEVRHLTRVVERAIPRELGRIRARERTLERYVYGKLTRRLERLAKLLGVGVLAGLIVKTLVRRFPWLFCRRVNLIGKRACGLDSDLLNSLLLDTLVIGGTISIVEFARELQAIEQPVAELIHSFIRDA